MAAVIGAVVILAGLGATCHAVRQGRASLRPVTPTPMRPPIRHPDDDVRLIEALFATWDKYIWDSVVEPAVTVAYTRQDPDGRWRVFITSRRQPLASAYVTAPHEPRPLQPESVSWHYISYADTTANAVNNVASDSYSRALISLPAQCRVPSESPRVIHLRRGGA
ncbi:MAG TPA: hypothetical protein VHX38_11595 [Pseudonocardiaceae bacterium]|nr:hypothetical protein [Pseudonocardiaceae bacterium]